MEPAPLLFGRWHPTAPREGRGRKVIHIALPWLGFRSEREWTGWGTEGPQLLPGVEKVIVSRNVEETRPLSSLF